MAPSELHQVMFLSVHNETVGLAEQLICLSPELRISVAGAEELITRPAAFFNEINGPTRLVTFVSFDGPKTSSGDQLVPIRDRFGRRNEEVNTGVG